MAENGTDVILDEISGDEIQSVLDTLMGNSSIMLHLSYRERSRLILLIWEDN